MFGINLNKDRFAKQLEPHSGNCATPPSGKLGCFLKRDFQKTMQFIKNLLLALLCAITLPCYAQRAGSIRGVIKDHAGNALAAITVKIDGGSKMTTSDNQGNYWLANISVGHHTLLFSGVGFKTVEKKIEANAAHESVVNVKLDENLWICKWLRLPVVPKCRTSTGRPLT